MKLRKCYRCGKAHECVNRGSKLGRVRAKLGTQPKAKRWQGDKSEVLKAKRGYTDPKSFVRVDGTEVLYNADWRNRKAELRQRSGGQCEYMIPDFAPEEGFPDKRCSRPATIPAHIEPRYPRRNDEMKNLKHYCFEHDRLTEKQGWRRTRFGEGSGKVEEK